MGGSQGIGKLVKTRAPQARKEYDYSYYTGKVLAVDLIQWLYKFKIAMINQPGIKSMTMCLWSKLLKMLMNGILPIFVLDGGVPKIKKGTLEKRRKLKELAKEKLKNLNIDDVNEQIKLKKRCVYIKDDDIKEAVDFLKLMGFQVILAIEEADPQCAGINIAGKAYGVISEDWDTLVFGAEKMITNFAKKNKIVEYDRDIVLESLGVDQEQFVELAIILGCDYCDPITIIGGDKSNHVEILYQKYMQYGSLEELLKGLRQENFKNKKGGIRYKIPQNLSDNWLEVKLQFLEVEIYDPQKKMNFEWIVPDYSELKTYFSKNDKRNVERNVNKIKQLFGYYSAYGCLVNLNNVINCAMFVQKTIIQKTLDNEEVTNEPVAIAVQQ